MDVIDTSIIIIYYPFNILVVCLVISTLWSFYVIQIKITHLELSLFEVHFKAIVKPFNGIREYMLLFLLMCSRLVAENFFLTLNVLKVSIGRLHFPRVLWEVWNDDLLPEDVEEMVNVSRKTLGLTNITYCFLNPSNLSQFLSVDLFPSAYATLPPQIKADYVRINLIAKFGGVWVDCTTYITSALEMEWFFSEGVRGNCELYGFSYGDSHEFLLSTNFFGACEGSFLMNKFKEEFDLSLRMGRRKYVSAVCRKLLPIKIVAPVHCIEYFTMFISFMKVMHDNDSLKNNVFFLSQYRDHEVLIRQCKLKRNCFRSRLLYDPIARAQPFIKVWHTFRDGKKFHVGDAEYELGLKNYPKQFVNLTRQRKKRFSNKFVASRNSH